MNEQTFPLAPDRLFEGIPKKERRRLLEREARVRRRGEWGEWETLTFPAGQAGSGWLREVTSAHRNRVFSVLERRDYSGALHLAIASLSGQRPSWHEMQRIKDEIAGPEATAVEVYPPQDEVVDGADMFHIWVVPGQLPFSLARLD